MGWVVFWIVMSGVVALVALSEGRTALPWFFYGALIWPIALVHVLVSPGSGEAVAKRAQAEGRVRCPKCAAFILPAAQVSPFCRSKLAEG